MKEKGDDMGEVSLASRAKPGNQGGVHRGERRAFCENDLCGVQYLEEGVSALGHRRCCKGMMVYRLRLIKAFVLMAVCLWCWQCGALFWGIRESRKEWRFSGVFQQIVCQMAMASC